MPKVTPLPENKRKAIKVLIEKGHVSDFSQLYQHLTVADIARAIGVTVKPVKRAKEDRLTLRLKDIFKLTEQLGITNAQMYDLLVPEEEKPKPKSRRKK